jgi:predicted 2-oxoglutarate/Fe(II)-dependent dioxygenase YbiX
MVTMATGIEVPYNDDLKPLERALAGVRRPGDFFAQGSLEAPMPRIFVRNVGVLSFPVPSAQVEAIIAQCERAPYGRGRETILDTTVRKVWQLALSRFDIGGKSWPNTFQQILATCAEELGCAGANVSAEIYKLLVYDEGAFFKAHRDTEKTEGMFGTLLIVLPSPHIGGELVVRHAGREATIDLSGDEVSELKFAAFYADCEHEVMPVTRGNRICLVYNLLQRLPRDAKNQPPLAAPRYDAETADAATLLEKAFTGAGAPTKIAWLLEHQYSSAALSFAALKSADKARAKALQKAAAQADCVMHLGIVHIEESGPAEYRDYRPHGPRGWRPSRYEQDEDASSEEFEVVEVADGCSYIDNWLTQEDRAADFGRLPLREGEVLPAGALEDEAPDEQRLLEASGNEGVSFERAYHRAALVLWPRSRFIDVLLQAGVHTALPYLETRTATVSSDADIQAALAEALQVVRVWEKQTQDESKGADFDSDADDSEFDRDEGEAIGQVVARDPKEGPSDRSRMLALLQRPSHVELLERFVRRVLTARFQGEEAEALAESARVLGAERCGALFSRLIQRRIGAAPCGCMSLFARLVSQHLAPIPRVWAAALRKIAASVVEGLHAVRGDSGSTNAYGGSTPEWQHKSSDTLTGLLKALTALEALRLRRAACAAIVANDKAFDPRAAIVPTLRKLNDVGGSVIGNSDYKHMWLHTANVLLSRSEHPPSPPRDWRQDARLSCDCEDCHELRLFAADPTRQTHRFRVNKDRRQHLHRQIDGYRLDMTHVTERKGSPQTLVCTKTRHSFLRRCAEYRQDIAALTALAELIEDSAGDCASHCARIAAAQERAAAGSPRGPMPGATA